MFSLKIIDNIFSFITEQNAKKCFQGHNWTNETKIDFQKQLKLFLDQKPTKLYATFSIRLLLFLYKTTRLLHCSQKFVYEQLNVSEMRHLGREC